MWQYGPVPITIRRLTPDDAEQYRACRLEALRSNPTAFFTTHDEEYKRSMEMTRERLETSDDNVVVGAFDGGRIIGLTGIVRESRQRLRHKMNIVGVFVRPEFTRQGIGSALVDAAIAHARSVAGVEVITLDVESTNVRAKALYTAKGFKTWGVEPACAKWQGVAYDQDYMSLRIE
jgi:RimJ/RimL family protein N-acetyltransferase